jgi:hypothetical protein
MSGEGKSNATKLGQFLRSVRLARAYSNINEYMRRYVLPISDVYYREIESGKRKISIDSAKELCEALQIDYADFYYHLLQDILPQEVQGDFISCLPKPIPLDDSAKELKKQQVKLAYQKNFVDRLEKRIGYMNEESESYFHQHPQYVKFLTSIYCKPKTSEAELRRILEHDSEQTGLEQVLEDFERLGLIKLSPAVGDRIIERAYNYIIIRDQKLLALRLLYETKVSIDNSCADVPHRKQAELLIHGIVGLNKNQYQEILTQLADLISQFRAAHEQGTEVDPYLLALLITPQLDYRLAEISD